MHFSLRVLVVLGLVGAMASAAFAQEEGKKKKNRDRNVQAVTQVVKKTEALGLNDEQTKKIKAIADSYAPKFKELNAKLVLTDAQKKARTDAVAKAKTDGLKRKEAVAAIDAALALTDEQKKARAEVQAGVKELTTKLNDEIAAVLTAEQKEKFTAKPKRAK